MWKSEFMESQIVGILAEGEVYFWIVGLCMKHGSTNELYYQWKSEYSGVSVSGLMWIRE